MSPNINIFLTWVNCDHCSHYFIAGSITLLLRVCVNLMQCYQYSILRRVCVSISKLFLTWVNCDHCSHYDIAGSITLLLRVCVNLVQCYRCSILRRVCVSISKHFLTCVNCDHCSHYFIAGSIPLLLSVSTWFRVIAIVISEGCVSAYLNTF